MSGPAFPRRFPEGRSGDAAGMTLIEASAGTGKTRILTGMVAGLVAVEHRRLAEILVVTFTRAATAELRDRIRETLRSTHRGTLDGESPAGSQAEELLARWRQDSDFRPEEATRRLEAAILDIDRANVFTIHGFCQRVLSDLAFDGGFPFGFEVSGDDADLVGRAARDFWRRRMYTASRTLAGYAVDKGFRPDDLFAWVRKWRGKPDLRIVGGEPLQVPVEGREAAWLSVLAEVRSEWEQHREGFCAEVLDGPWLNRRRYARPRVEREVTALEAALGGPDPLLPKEGFFGRYGAEVLATACKKGHTLRRIRSSPPWIGWRRRVRSCARPSMPGSRGPGARSWTRWGSRSAAASSRTGASPTTTSCSSSTARCGARTANALPGASGRTTRWRS